MNIAGVIFDMDGVLFDSEPMHAKKRSIFFEKEHVECIEEECNRYVGLEPRAYFPNLLKTYTTEEIATFIEKYKSFHYETEAMYETCIFPDTASILKELRLRKIKLAVASSSPKFKIEKALRATKINHYFDVIISGESLKQSKPNPEIYLHTIKEMGLHQSQLLVVEDSTYGIQAAKKAGLFVIAKRESRFHIDQSQADAYIDTLSELSTLI